MSLREYQRKRIFSKTPEPEGKKKNKPGKQLSFVIQKHAASRTHYDFRLELDGVLKSWAVPKGPSLTFQDPRLAVHVEDHPLEYGKFEGVIPRGNYGAGTVMVWDRGYYLERTSQNRRESEKKLRKGMEEGHITFILHGEKLQGEFALVRLKKKGAPDNGWLLIKKHDAFASREDITKLDHSVKSGRSMQEITLESPDQGDVWIPKKGIRGKIARSTMPRKIRAMQPLLSTKLPEGDWIFEETNLGVRAIAEVDPATVKLYSRMFLPFEKKYPAIVRALRSLKVQAVLDGEITKKGTYALTDLLFFNGEDLRDLPLIKRKEKLSELSLPSPLQLASWEENLEKIHGRETVAKKKNSTYQSGLSRDWLRVKSVGNKAISPLLTSEKPPLTHLNKIFWPEEKYTKGDLVQYYESIAKFILPHLVDRPQSLHRQPNGIKDAGFFHKDMTSFLPRRIPLVKVHSASANKTVHYLLCQDKWTLLYLINMGCIELNPWLSRRDSLENPDYVVIDLDPDENPFEEVVEVALEVRRVLKSIVAKAYCKTSGGTGLHICVPTNAKFDYDTCRIFAERVCREVHKKFPKTTSLERTPARRRGKIYLDFLQNRRGQTLAAPYCVRPRPGAPVSTPLKWEEVKKGLDPESFTIKNTLKRLTRLGDLWKPLLTEFVDIQKCAKRLR